MLQTSAHPFTIGFCQWQPQRVRVLASEWYRLWWFQWQPVTKHWCHNTLENQRSRNRLTPHLEATCSAQRVWLSFVVVIPHKLLASMPSLYGIESQSLSRKSAREYSLLSTLLKINQRFLHLKPQLLVPALASSHPLPNTSVFAQSEHATVTLVSTTIVLETNFLHYTIA